MNFIKKTIVRPVVDKIAEQTSERVFQGLPSEEKTALRVSELVNQNLPLDLLADALCERVIRSLPLDLLAEKLCEKIAPVLAEKVVQGLPLDQLAERAYNLANLQRRIEASPNKTPNEVFAGVSDDHWVWTHTQGYKIIPEFRELLPGLADAHTRLCMAGLAGDEDLRQGFVVYRHFKQFYEYYNGSLTDCEAVFDFGCGWGRVMRFFLREVAPSRMWGVDPVRSFLESGRRTNTMCHLDVAAPMPPLAFPDDKFDLVYCFSVFSHLPEDVHKEWLVELRRVLKPGGMLLATTSPRWRILADDGKIYKDKEKWLAAYDQGQFCHDAYPNWKLEEGFPYCWGDTCIPKSYVESEWTKLMTLLEFDELGVCGQPVIAMRK
jgi:SAM-dependent methyltransferase